MWQLETSRYRPALAVFKARVTRILLSLSSEWSGPQVVAFHLSLKTLLDFAPERPAWRPFRSILSRPESILFRPGRNIILRTFDPSIPFPLEGQPDNIIAFGQKLTAQGIPCLMWPTTTTNSNPSDPQAYMAQLIPRLVSLAQIAESAGCESRISTLCTENRF
jgi:hypothetical protein